MTLEDKVDICLQQNTKILLIVGGDLETNSKGVVQRLDEHENKDELIHKEFSEFKSDVKSNMNFIKGASWMIGLLFIASTTIITLRFNSIKNSQEALIKQHDTIVVKQYIPFDFRRATDAEE